MDPINPAGNNLTIRNPSPEVELHNNITYGCLPKNWFYHDRGFDSFNVTCLENNTMDYPREWQFCVSSRTKFLKYECTLQYKLLPLAKYCIDPPIPVIGGNYTWDAALYSGSNTPYTHSINYTCQRGRMLSHPDGSFYTFHQKECLWDRTWSPATPVSF